MSFKIEMLAISKNETELHDLELIRNALVTLMRKPQAMQDRSFSLPNLPQRYLYFIQMAQ